MKIKNLPELKTKLKTFLPEYLKKKSIKIERNKLQCPNHVEGHEHNDLRKLSAAFLPQSNNTLVYCFVEDRKFDIFDAYSILENKRITGQGFYECVKTLCKMFDITYEEDDVYSIKDIDRKKKRTLLQKIHKISAKNVTKGIPLFKDRGLNKNQIKHWRIGYIEPKLITDEIDREIKKYFGYTLPLTHPALVIPVLNEYRQYIGLIIRQYGGEKNCNYLNISLEGKNLFNIESIKGEEYLYITEGIFDTISLYPETNVISILTNSLHDKDLEKLSKFNFKKVYIALDSDNLYQGKARDGILKTILKLKNVDTSINVIILPTDSDPDSYIKNNSLEAFKKLPKISAIKYLLTNYQKELIPIERIYEFISGNPNLIKKGKLISVVAKTLDLNKKQITKEISKLEDREGNYNIITYVQEKESLLELLGEFTDMAWNQEFKGIQTGFPLFDKHIGGFEDTIYTLVGFPGSGKCHGKDTPILMYDGCIKNVQDIKENDLLMGETSLPTIVTSTTSGQDEMFKIVPTKGDAFVCNKAHILVVNYNTNKDKTIEITVGDFLQKSKAFQERCKLIRCGVKFPANYLNYDPYFIGQWLGDGSRGCPTITQNEPEIESYYSKFATTHNLKYSKQYNKNGCPCYTFTGIKGKPNPLTSELKTLVVKGEKCIPRKYLVNSRENRLSLLAGLLDSDGYLHNNCWELITAYPKLKNDMLYLIRSLGFGVNVTTKKVKGYSKDYYRIWISGNLSDIPNKLERKQVTKKTFRKNALRVGFKVLPIGKGTYYGFTLESDSNGRYLLGDFTLTHNTSMLLNFSYQLMLNPNNYVAFYSLDDGAKRAIIPRFLSMITGLTSKLIKEPNDNIKDLWQKGMDKLTNLQANFTIKDGADIRTVWDLDNFIKIHYNIAQENKKKFIVVIDNLHSLTSSYKFQSVENTQRIANYLKRVPQKFHCPIITTAEVPKSAGKRPTGKDIKESIDIWYASRFVGGIHSDFHEKADSNLIWRDIVDGDEKLFPIMEIFVSKNQTGMVWQGSLYYKFSFINNRFIECTEEESSLLKEGQYLY